MVTVGDIYDAIDKLAPFSNQCEWDNSGLIIGDRKSAVTKVMTVLDITANTAKEAVENNVDLIVSHHPIIFKGLKRIDTDTPLGALLVAGVSVISAHTSFDVAGNGLNKLLCGKLGLSIIPNTPLAYDGNSPIGNVCKLEREMTATELAKNVKDKLGCVSVRYTDNGEIISLVGVCCGSGGEYFSVAKSLGCQALITGDVKHHDFIDAFNAGMTVIDAGHFYTERLFSEYMAKMLSEAYERVEVFSSKTEADTVSYL